EYLKSKGISSEIIEQLPLLGISGIANLQMAIKMAKYYEMDEDDVIVTVLTDSEEMYTSRVKEMHEAKGKFTSENAAAIYAKSLIGQGIDYTLELSYYEKLRIHNLKYYTWIEQQGKTYEEINAQWYDKNYWTNIQELTEKIDKLIEDFNKDVGIL
ncbi:MAG: pyridoxal-5-phosphate-dependent protein subunit beta, partial [Spirochaetota bacterium]|nr:pyridoxal-5-phosphate-dependent protein subunit beta [Spirochaetota bacterium]